MNAIELSIIIPVYHAELSLLSVVERTIETISPHFASFEVICVDDGSQDFSWKEIKAICDRFPSVKGLRLSRNFGQWPATICGLRNASGKLLLMLDDDGQSDPNEGLKLIGLVRDGKYDVACGIRKMFRNYLIEGICRIFFSKKLTSSMTAMRREVVFGRNGAVRLRMGLDPYSKWMLDSSRIGQMRIPYIPRKQGDSGYGLLGLLRFIKQNFSHYFGRREIFLFTTIVGAGAALTFHVKPALLALIAWMSAVVVLYLAAVLVDREQKPYYWIIEEWPPTHESSEV